MKEQLQEYIDDFLDYLIDIRGYSEKTILTYEIALGQMIKTSEYYKENNKNILNIMPFRLKIASNSKKTITKKLSAIRSFVKYLNEQRSINIHIKGDSSIKVPQTLPKPIEEVYIDEVIATADIADRLIVVMLYGLGLRISELSGLRLDQISSEWISITGKGNKTRQLPLLPYIQQLIKDHIDSTHPKRYLFEKNATPLNASQLRYRVDKLFKSQGIKATPHQLRHSFATHLLNNGARISDVSKLLGHSSMATTQIYTKLGSVKKMEEYMKAHPLAGF